MIIIALISAVVVVPFAKLLTYLLKAKPRAVIYIHEKHNKKFKNAFKESTFALVLGYVIVALIYLMGGYFNFVIAASLDKDEVNNWTVAYIVSLITNQVFK